MTPQDELEGMTGDDLAKEMYAHFGLAYFTTELIYRSLVQLFLLDLKTCTRPMVEETLKLRERQTLGALAKDAKVHVPEALHVELDWAVSRRNYLAHGFWYEENYRAFRRNDQLGLIAELREDITRFESLEQALAELGKPVLERMGVNEDALTAYMEVARSVAMDPLPERELPPKQLRIVRAWIYSGPDGHALHLEDADGLQWQPCDVGLHWAYRNPSAEPHWAPCERLNQHLPATVVPRPKGATDWNFELTLARGARFVMANNAGKITWKIVGPTADRH